MKLASQRILITGAGGGIGRELTDLLAARGARLGLLDRGPAALAALERQATELSVESVTIEADITSADDRRQALQAMQQAFGGIDLLVNLAGMLDFRPFERTDPGTLTRLLAVNVEAPMQLTLAVLPQMTARGSGRVVNIGSMFGSIAFPCFAAYSASKFALRGFSQALRRELAGSGVGVTYVSPRAVKTAFNPPVVHHMAEQGMMRMDEAGWVAAQIVAAVERDRDEAYLGFPESLFARINALAPGVVDKSIVKQLPDLLAFAREGG